MPTNSATLSLTKPRLRGVSHQWAFFVSLAFGAALVVAAPAGQPRLAAAIYALTVAALFGTSAAVSPDHAGHRVAAGAGCGGSTTR